MDLICRQVFRELAPLLSPPFATVADLQDASSAYILAKSFCPHLKANQEAARPYLAILMAYEQTKQQRASKELFDALSARSCIGPTLFKKAAALMRGDLPAVAEGPKQSMPKTAPAKRTLSEVGAASDNSQNDPKRDQYMRDLIAYLDFAIGHPFLRESAFPSQSSSSTTAANKSS